jgi:hypothetical protein
MFSPEPVALRLVQVVSMQVVAVSTRRRSGARSQQLSCRRGTIVPEYARFVTM